MQDKNALLSVSDKHGLDDLATALVRHGWQLWASGGTGTWLEARGFRVRSSAELTGFATLLDGRVKTLDAKIHAGILARSKADEQALEELNIPRFALVVVNVYPFAEQAPQATPQEAIELIDIGGPALLRAAAKNASFTAPLAAPEWYPEAIAALEAHGGTIPRALAEEFAARTFALTAAYDSAIAAWYAGTVQNQNEAQSEPQNAKPEALPAQLVLPPQETCALHYGENPHQAGQLYRFAGTGGTAHARLLHPTGAKLSYNNHADLEAAWQMAQAFAPATPAVAVIKHTTPCGVAVGRQEQTSPTELLQTALEAGGTDSYGGIVATNFAPKTKPEAEALAEVLQKHFLELVAMPADPDSQDAVAHCAALLSQGGATRRLVVVPPQQETAPAISGVQIRSLSGGLLAQTLSHDPPLNLCLEAAPETWLTDWQKDWQQVSGTKPTLETCHALAFAWRVAGKALSNAIVAATCETQGETSALRTLRIAGGQTSRVAACQQVADALATFNADFNADPTKVEGNKNSVPDAPLVAASDGFFPFADGLELLAQAGVQALVAPSGSKRDSQVAAAAEQLGLALFFSPRRGFRH